MTDMLKNEGLVKTDMYCHECGKNFIARLDYSIEGNHEIECPICGHTHCRVITNGKVTGERWDSRYGRVEVGKRNVWKANDLKVETSTTSHFLRERWLNFGNS